MTDKCLKYLLFTQKLREVGDDIILEGDIMDTLDDIWYSMSKDEIAVVNKVEEKNPREIFVEYLDLRQALLDARKEGCAEDVIVDQMNDAWERMTECEKDIIRSEGTWKFKI